VSGAAPELTPKGRRTRALIVETALELLLERGYEATTMRDLAERTGLSLGSLYYHFPSKEHLIQGFYARTHVEHLAACEPALARTRKLESRLRLVMEEKLRTIEPYHHVAGVLFKHAADPKSPLNPFSDESGEVRDEAIALFERLVEGSDVKLPKDLAEELPWLLWVYHLGVILFWIHDDSEGRRRSARLVERTVDIVARLVRLAGNPLLAPVRRSTLRLLREIRDE